MRQLEEKIQILSKNLEDLQSTLRTTGRGGGGRNPADAAQPEMKETIHNIQTKLEQLDSRTQVAAGSPPPAPPQALSRFSPLCDRNMIRPWSASTTTWATATAALRPEQEPAEEGSAR